MACAFVIWENPEKEMVKIKSDAIINRFIKLFYWLGVRKLYPLVKSKCGDVYHRFMMILNNAYSSYL